MGYGFKHARCCSREGEILIYEEGDYLIRIFRPFAVWAKKQATSNRTAYSRRACCGSRREGDYGATAIRHCAFTRHGNLALVF
jgi:hypothetical protein